MLASTSEKVYVCGANVVVTPLSVTEISIVATPARLLPLMLNAYQPAIVLTSVDDLGVPAGAHSEGGGRSGEPDRCDLHSDGRGGDGRTA